MNIDLSEPGVGPDLIVHVVDPGLRKRVSRDGYQQLIAYARQMALSVHEWSGEDREGRPMAIVWVQIPNGRELAAYEIQGA